MYILEEDGVVASKHRDEVENTVASASVLSDGYELCPGGVKTDSMSARYWRHTLAIISIMIVKCHTEREGAKKGKRFTY